MARTSQKAKKSTGGSAPAKQRTKALAPLVVSVGVDHARADSLANFDRPDDVSTTNTHLQFPLTLKKFCSVCREGGKQAVCSRSGCNRTVCAKCLGEELYESVADKAHVPFTCFSCGKASESGYNVRLLRLLIYLIA